MRPLWKFLMPFLLFENKKKEQCKKWKHRHRTKDECEGLREACTETERFQMKTVSINKGYKRKQENIYIYTNL